MATQPISISGKSYNVNTNTTPYTYTPVGGGTPLSDSDVTAYPSQQGTIYRASTAPSQPSVAAKPVPVVAKPAPVVAKPVPVVAKPVPVVARPIAAAKPGPSAEQKAAAMAAQQAKIAAQKVAAMAAQQAKIAALQKQAQQRAEQENKRVLANQAAFVAKPKQQGIMPPKYTPLAKPSYSYVKKTGGTVKKQYTSGGQINLDACGVSTASKNKKSNW